MSASRVVLPVLDLEQIDDPLRKSVLKGAKQINTMRLQADTFNNNGMRFQIQPPSQNTVIDRRVEIEGQFSISTRAQEAGVAHVGFTNSSKNGQFNANVPLTKIGNIGFTTSSSRATQAVVVPSAGAGANASIAVFDTNSSSEIYQANNFAPRQLPLNSIIDNIDVVINGTHFTTDIGDYLHAVAQYTSPEFRQQNLTKCYHHPDVDANPYGDFVRNQGTANVNTQNGSAGRVNPLAIEKYAGRLGETPRGVFLDANGMAVQAGGGDVPQAVADPNGSIMCWSNSGLVAGARSQVLNFKFIEPLIISPFTLSYGEGMTNINNMEINIRFKNDLSGMFSYFNANGDDAGANGAGVAGQVFNAGQIGMCADGTAAVGAGALIAPLLPANMGVITIANTGFVNLRTYTPQDDIRIPNEIVLPYSQPKRFTTNTVALARGVQQTLTLNSRRLAEIPEALYIWAQPQPNLRVQGRAGNAVLNGFRIPNCFSSIENISIQFGNQVGILNGHQAWQLVDIAKENGCDLVDHQESQTRGYCLKLVFGKDIPLLDNESAGTRGDYNIQITITHRHNSVALVNANDWQVNEMYVNNGQVIISPNECRVQTGLLDLKDNIEATNMGHKYQLGKSGDLAGGAFLSGMGHYWKKLPHYVSKVIKHLPDIIDTGRSVMKAVDDPSLSNVVSAGRKAKGLHKGMSGGSVSGGSHTGGSYTGGAYRSRRHR